MLKLVLEDLVKERGALRTSLLRATQVTPRSDYIDCWNLLDEIAEHDRRIETLHRIMAEVAPEPVSEPSRKR